MRNELQAFDTGIPTGAGLRDPAVIMDEAKERCQVLTAMVEQTKSFTQIGPSKHLRVEAWITCAQFYGCTGRIVQTEDISIAGVVGFKAQAQVFHDQTGTLLSSADAICMQDEANWEKKPLHQIMSMAQTRALSKALAAKFRWVVVLGGFSPTPAEEVSGDEKAASKKAKPAPQPNEPCVPNYGPAAGQPFSQVSTDHLKDYLRGVSASVDDPKKERFKASNEKMRDALKAEIAKREQKPAASQPAAAAAPVAHQEHAAGSPVPGGTAAGQQPEYETEWIADVIDYEDKLRGTTAGTGTLRAIRAGFNLTDGNYPMLPEQQAEYYKMVKTAWERMGKPA